MEDILQQLIMERNNSNVTFGQWESDQESHQILLLLVLDILEPSLRSKELFTFEINGKLSILYIFHISNRRYTNFSFQMARKNKYWFSLDVGW